MKQLVELYIQWKGKEPERTEKLPGAGSNRVYYRMYDSEGRSVVGCVGTSHEENHAFVSLSRHFRAKQLPVPEVLAVSQDELRYLQTDLGATSLFDALKHGREAGGNYSADEQALLCEAMRQLPQLQVTGAQELDFSVCYPMPDFDEMGVMFDLNYFKYCFLKTADVDFHEVRLEHDFRRMAKDLTSEPGTFFLYRDFQARNVMVAQNSPLSCFHSPLYFIDFQGGRRGPLYYDVASFLWQASARYPDELRRRLVDEYYEVVRQLTTLPPRDVFDRKLRLFVFFRTLQVLGAYGFRGYFERKRHFIESIPAALQNLRQLMGEGAAGDYPYLSEVLSSLIEKLSSLQNSPKLSTLHSPLIIRVFSFSYKKGIPEDESGNGGGYVFDCRSTHNPGRYDEYKQMTGLDQPVIRFLEDDGEITAFLESVYRLADAHVERYMERGFTSLMFCFGCTGGQHRSVYSAQHLAEHLHQKYGIEVRLCHREQHISTIFPPKQ